MSSHLIWLFTFLALYWAYCLFCGVKGAMSARTASDYFIAGRNITAWVFVLALTAASFSGWALMEYPGWLYRGGFQYAYIGLCAIAIPLTGVIFLRRQWLLGKRFGFVTPGEMLAHYFKSNTMRLVVVFIALVFAVPLLGLQLRASGFLLNVLTDNWSFLGITDTDVGIILGMWLLSIVMFVCVTVGGLRAVAYMSSLQCVLLAAGIVILGTLVMVNIGGFEQLNQSIAHLALSDDIRTPDGYSHYLAISGVAQTEDSAGVENANSGGVWTGVMLLTTVLAFMGIQSAPTFTMWAFAAKSTKSFAPQQVWASALAFGFILVLCSVIQGMGSHFFGADTAFTAAHLEQVRNVLGAGLHHQDLMESTGQHAMLVPQLINLFSVSAPWLMGLLAVCALAAIQSAGAAYLSTAGAMLTRDLLMHFVMPNANHVQQILFGRICIFFIIVAALLLATSATDALILLGGLAIAYGLQMWPSLLAVCWFPWLTRTGCLVGLITGLIVVTLTEKIGAQFMPWQHWPWAIHPAAWGILFNLGLTVIISAMSQHRDDMVHKMNFHHFLRKHASLSVSKQNLVPLAWVLTLLWFFLSVGPGAVIGNTLFGNPNNYTTWVFGIPSIWAWQFLWWGLGVFMLWFLAYRMEMSKLPNLEVTVLFEDIADIRIPNKIP